MAEGEKSMSREMPGGTEGTLPFRFLPGCIQCGSGEARGYRGSPLWAPVLCVHFAHIGTGYLCDALSQLQKGGECAIMGERRDVE